MRRGAEEGVGSGPTAEAAAARDCTDAAGSADLPESGLEGLWRDIEKRMGVTPSFFRLAQADPAIARGLFRFAEFAYLDSSPPALLKEKLFTYLSRFCDSRYCVARHAAFLLGRGHIAGDPAVPALQPEEVGALLVEPLPDAEELPKILQALSAEQGPLAEWPEFDSALGKRFRVACAMLFINPSRCSAWSAMLRRLLGGRRYEQLMLFLAFVRTAHFWTQVHPDLSLEEDIQVLLDEHQALAGPLMNAEDVERSTLGRQLLDELNELREAGKLAYALRESEASYRDLYDNAPDMYCSVDADTGLVMQCNLTFLRNTGFTRDEVVGHPVLERYDEASIEAAKRCFEEFRSSGEVRDAQLRLRTRDGGPLDVTLSVTAVRDKSGRIVSSRSVLRDVTERRRAEEGLKRSERIYRGIGESILYGVWICDAEGRNIYASPSFLDLIGITQEQCSDLGWSEMLHPDDVEETVRAWQDAVAEGRSWERSHRFRGADGGWHHVLARGVPIRNDRGIIECWAGINLDISDLKEAEIGLREAGRQKDEFLATLAHELRNPLAPIRNSLRMLRTKSCDVAAADAARAMIERQVDHVVRLVDDLMEVSRITRGKIDLRKEYVPLQSIVANAVELASPVIEAARHHLDIDVPDEPIVIHADPLRIAQAIGNLLNNAAKYTDENGRIRLAARRSRDELVISVSDTGVGIAAEMLPRVFDMFLQVDSTLRRAQGGLGIGLTLVRRLVELHGGRVDARSEGVGRGSEFIIRLPMSEHETLLQQVIAPAPQQVVLTPRRLLVVDDNRDAADSLAMLLESAGNEVRVVYDAQGALEILRSFHPAVVFLDIGMPDMDGYELARRIRQRPELRDVSIVALTGWGHEDDRRRAAAAGCDEHLVKPVSWEAIQSVLASLDPA